MEQNIIIRGTGIYLPKNEVSNEYFEEYFRRLGVEVKGLMAHLNRQKRFLADRDEASLSMGYEASKNVLEKLNMDPEELDMIVFATDTPEYNMPTNALKLNHMLKAKNAHRVYDMNCNCTGMLVAMDVVAGYMQQRPSIRKTLLVGSMHVSSVVKYRDSVSYPSFGDSGAALVFENIPEEEKRGILDSEYLTDSDYHDTIVLPECGHSKELLYEVPKENRRMAWNPFDFSFLSDNWAEIITRLLEKHHVSLNEVKRFVFSQFSDADNRLTLEKLGVDLEKYIFVGDKYGYTGVSSPIMALNEIWESLEQQEGYLVFCSVAAGYSMNAILYKL
ncbi:MAG: ketoacyl-ACP synthase III [Lachnospiraceae bacterium]|nr:ketoacyl-ACP synthase III [Lachnospiraceae bacterium]